MVNASNETRNKIWHAETTRCLHTQTRPFKPTAISNESFFPKVSSTGHVGVLRSLQTTYNFSYHDLLKLESMHGQIKINKLHTFLRDQLNTQTYNLLLGHQTLQLSH
jgi:hypothetical protein